VPKLLPRFQGQSLGEIRKAAKEAPGIDDMPVQEPTEVGPSSEQQILRGIPVIGSGGGAIPGTRPDQRTYR
jgi:hypothetical protein